MKEKEDKLRLVKQILVNDDDIDPALIIPQKQHNPDSPTKVFSDTETRTSRKVTRRSITFSFKVS